MGKVIGFIGSGNMAQAMIGSLIKGKVVDKEDIIASEIFKEVRDKVASELGIRTTDNNMDVAKESDIIILSVKPNIYETVLNEIKDRVKEGAIIIGIGAGISSDFLKNSLNESSKYVKVMPNTPALVGEGMSAISKSNNLDAKELEEVVEIMEAFGKVEILDEKLIDGFTAIAGSSPAYVYMMIEALADGAVLEGLPRKQAYTIAAQAVLGSAKMVLETGIHPGELKDNVCSPGGTTIAAVASLEENNFRSTLIEAVVACADKSREMNK